MTKACAAAAHDGGDVAFGKPEPQLRGPCRSHRSRRPSEPRRRQGAALPTVPGRVASQGHRARSRRQRNRRGPGGRRGRPSSRSSGTSLSHRFNRAVSPDVPASACTLTWGLPAGTAVSRRARSLGLRSGGGGMHSPRLVKGGHRCGPEPDCLAGPRGEETGATLPCPGLPGPSGTPGPTVGTERG